MRRNVGVVPTPQPRAQGAAPAAAGSSGATSIGLDRMWWSVNARRPRATRAATARIRIRRRSEGGGATGANTTLGVCPGNNPDIGVTCNQILVGGITVLSGPHGIYGEQGLQAAQAWLSYYNAVYAPAHHLRQEKRWRPFSQSYAEQECAAFHKRTGRIIKLLTVQEILDEEHVQKM